MASTLVPEDWQSGQNLQGTNLYMLDNELGTDIILTLGEAGSRLRAHKFMLASRSQVFFAMFYGPLAETGSEIIIPDIDYDVMKTFVRYLYSEEVHIAPDNVMGLMYTAKKYGSQDLVHKCRAYLQTEINADNVCTIMEQAHLFDEQELWNQCLATVFSNSVEVLTNEDQDYKSLCYECLKCIVENDKLVAKEEQVFTACINWGKGRCLSKQLKPNDINVKDVLNEILYLIRFPLMSERAFTELVSTGDLLTAEEKLEIYQYFNQMAHRRAGGLENTFKYPTKPRTDSQEFQVERFQEKVGGTFDFWINDNLVDAVSFKCSRSVAITGISVFSPFPNGIIRGSIRIFDGTNTCIAKKDYVEIIHAQNKMTHNVRLKKPLKIEENRWYTVQQQMTGAKSFFGKNGQREVMGQGVVFSFRNSPMDENNTNVDSGQIYGLLYC